MLVSVSWERVFRAWHYSVSYSQLLFRSVDANKEPRRIDVLFSNVERMEVDSRYERFAVQELDAANVKWSQMRISMHRGAKPFSINAGSGFVVATHCQWHQDDGDALSPSKFGPLPHTD
jgi:hypothetical protein